MAGIQQVALLQYVVIMIMTISYTADAQVPPQANSLTMYVGGNDGGTPAVPVGQQASATHEIDEGDNLIFTCLVMDANPAADITWTLPGATLNGLDIDASPVNNLIDTINSLLPTYHVVVEGNCGDDLVCTSNHPATGDTQTDQTQLLVVVAPDDVNLQLLSTSNGPAALTGAEGSDITNNNQAVGEAQTETKLVLICGQMYDFQSSTTNGVTPEADFMWEIRPDVGTSVTPEFDDPAGDPDTVTCSPAATTSNLDDFEVQYNDDNGQYLCAIADNKHVAAGPVRECVCLDVNVEVQQANMVMTVTRTSDNTVVDLAGGENLIHDEEYTVDCVVREATPPPSIAIGLGGDLGATTPSPAQANQAEGAGITREAIVTSARATFTADYDTQCNGDLACSAMNSANTLTGTGTQTVTEAAVKVSAPPTAPAITLELTDTTADQDGNNADDSAILIEGMAYEFTCTVTSDPEVDVVWTLVSTANSNEVVETDLNSGVIDCTSDPYPETYQLPADRVTYANLQCGTLTCSAGGESKTMTFQIWKPPTLAPGGAGVGGGDGIQLRVSTDGGTTWSAALNHLQTLDPTANTNYLFECTVFDITTVDPTPAGFPAQVCPPSNIATVVRDIVDIDLFSNRVDGITANDVFSMGVSGDAELATGPGPGLYDLIDTYMYTVLGSDACPSTVTCRAAFDPTIPLHSEDASNPFITVRIARTVEPTIVSLVLNPTAGFPNNDQDGDNNDATAILIEGLSYNFECTVNADPEVNVVWTVKDSTGTPIPAYSETDNNNLLDCADVTDDYTETYELTEVTHAALQCGSICCTAGTETEEIKFQIWKPSTVPGENGGGGGGAGIQLSYRLDPPPAAPAANPWIPIHHNENIPLDVNGGYEFQCIIYDISPDPDGATGVCPAGSTDALDILDIDFYINTNNASPNTAGTFNDGDENDAEPATANANGVTFDLTDTLPHTVLDAHFCPTYITCRADVDATFAADVGVPANFPFTIARITHINPTTSVTLVTPDFVGNLRGEVDDNTDPKCLSLYDGDTYILSCAPQGADPDADIRWYLVNRNPATGECVAHNPSNLVRDVFVPHETTADCELQNGSPPDHDGDSDIWTSFLADFASQNDKCLRCVALDNDMSDEYKLDIRKAPSIIGYDGPTDDDNDGLDGEQDELDQLMTLCNGQPFDLLIIASGANPAVDPFDIKLDTVTVDNDTPRSGITVSPVTVQPSSIGVGLFDSRVVVSFPEGGLTLQNNEAILEICDPGSMVCFNITLNIVDPPDSVTFYVSNPFAANNQEANTRVRSNQDEITLLQDEPYRLVCTADNASPPSDMTLAIGNPPIEARVSVSEHIHTPDPESDAVTPATLYDTNRMITIEIATEQLDGRQICCQASNLATYLKNQLIRECKTLNVIAQTIFIGVGDMLYDRSNNIPVLDQERTSLICFLRGAPGQVGIQWSLDGQEIDSQLHSETYQTNADSPSLVDVRSTYTFTPRLSSHDGDSVTCSSSAIGQSTVNYLEVVVPPDVPMISINPEWNSQDNVLIFGQRHVITCAVTGATPAADITFELDGVPIESTSTYDTVNTQNGRLRDSFLETRILATWSTHDGAQLTCSAVNEAIEMGSGSPDDYSTSVTLSVLSPSLDVELSLEQPNNDAVDNAFEEGTTLVIQGPATFHCRGLKAKPASSLQWKLNNEVVPAASFNSTSNSDGYTFDSDSSYILEASFDSIESTLTCCASNGIEDEGSELCEMTTLDVIAEPSNIIISDGTRIYGPGSVMEVRRGMIVTCTAIGAKPAGTIGWDLDGVFIGGTSGVVTTNQENELLSDFSYNLDYPWTLDQDGGVLTCIALNTANSRGVTTSVIIDVQAVPTPPPRVTTRPMSTTSQSPVKTTVAEDTLTTTLTTQKPATIRQMTTATTITPTEDCRSNPCVNQGVCISQAVSSTYVCQCTPAYTGRNCENRVVFIDPCSRLPCLNRGTCYALSQTDYRCVCTTEFGGTTCANPAVVDDSPPIVIEAPVSVRANLFNVVTLTCRITNINTILWTKDGRHLAEHIGEETITIPSVSARDQGRYTCSGQGTSDGTVVERDATIIVQGILLFFVIGARFPSFQFNADLTNPDSLSYAETASRIESFLEQQFTTIGSLPRSLVFQVTSLSDGSVIADANMYIEESGEPIITLIDTIERGFSVIANENNWYFDASNVNVKSAGICESEICDASPHGTLYIPATTVGQDTDPGSVIPSVTGACPWYTFNADRPMVSGFCDGDFLSQPRFLEDSIICTCGRNLTVDEQLRKLAEIELTMDNVQSVLDDATSITERSQSISVDGVQSAIDIIVNAVEVQSPEPMVTNGVIGVINNVMDVSPDTLQESQDSINDATLALETQLQNVVVSEDTPYHNVRANLAADVHEVSRNDLRDGLGIVSTGAAAEALLDENIMLVDSLQLADEVRPEADTMIFIPASVFDAVRNTESEMIRVTFAFFSTPALFKSVSLAESNSNNQGFQRDINTRVLSCTVGGRRINNLEEPIRTVFQRISSDYFNTANNSACVYWDYEADRGRGNWSTLGCRTIGEIQNGRQECECDHLTNFAVLMDIYGQTSLTQVQALILKIISLLGCSMSFAAVAATFLTYLTYKKLRKKQHSQILVNMCFALMLLYITFIVMVSLDSTRNPLAPEVNVIGCSILAGVLQFAVLSSLAWMGIEGVNMYLQFVKVLNNYVPNFMRKAFAVGWGIPLAITILTGVAAKPYARRDYCFLEKDPLIYGVMLPIGIILACNFVIFGLVVHRISNLKGNRAGKAGSKLEVLKHRLRRAFTILTLMGLTWSIGYLSLIFIASGIVQILFCMFNILQGVAIFVLYCVRQPEVLRFWQSFDFHTLVTGKSETFTQSRSREQSSGTRQNSQPKRRPVINRFDPASVPWTSSESRRFEQSHANE
ncbi:uncharacterized protein [Amphiura filiformis]|uniref:uncharacterized protein n=1 Tax=Amphiura filiformis TaxID=82378 RepID=UPI003B213714